MPTSVARIGNNLPNGNFNPQVWSQKLNVKFYAQLCLMDICNTDWEGDIKGQGASVLIRNIPTVDVNDYVIGQDMSFQDILDEKIELLINNAKYFNVKIDDIDTTQQDIKLMNQLTVNAGKNMKTAIEKHVFGSVYADAGNSIATLTMDKNNVLDWIVDAGVIMEENNLPLEDRWLIIPPKAGGMIQKSDLKNTSLTGDDKSVLRSGMTNGRLGEVAGITLYISNQLAKAGTTYQCLAGHKSAVTYASQIVKVRHVVPTGQFAEAVQGLNVYGFKTVAPAGLISMPAIIA